MKSKWTKNYPLGSNSRRSGVQSCLLTKQTFILSRDIRQISSGIVLCPVSQLLALLLIAMVFVNTARISIPTQH